MKLSLIDLHCDTASELYHRNKQLLTNDLHVSLDKIKQYEHYAQVFAIYTDASLSDEQGYKAYLRIAEHFKEELLRNQFLIGAARSGGEMEGVWTDNRSAAFLAVEDARLLCGQLERLHTLYADGVRFVTLMWSGETCIGGSWNTDSGLTDFGKDVVRECFRLGIVPDVSHASERSVDDVIELATEYGKPFIATHSNAYSVYGHGRNLRDRHFAEVRDLGGLVGINLYRDHLTDTRISPATKATVLSHVDHFLSLGGENTVAFGADYDGAELPDDLPNVSAIAELADTMLAHNYPEELVKKLFWKNAEAFLLRALPRCSKR